MNIQVRNFNPERIKSNSIVFFIGRRNSGKSVCLRHIMSFHPSIKTGTVVSSTETADFWTASTTIYTTLDETTISKFIEVQSRKCQNAFLVLDNCYWTTWEDNIKHLLMNARQYQAFILITMPYPHNVPPYVPVCVDYVFIFRCTNKRDKKRIYAQYAGMFPSFDVFSYFMDQCTEDFECIVIDNTVASNKLEDQVFRFKVPASYIKSK